MLCTHLTLNTLQKRHLLMDKWAEGFVKVTAPAFKVKVSFKNKCLQEPMFNCCSPSRINEHDKQAVNVKM